MTFHIGSQQGGVVNNVGRDQHVEGGQAGTVQASGVDPAAVVLELREALAGAHLPDAAAADAAAQVDELEQAVNSSQPDRKRAATALEKLTRILVAAGPLASAAVAFAGPLGALAGWLGPLGQAVTRLVPSL